MPPIEAEPSAKGQSPRDGIAAAASYAAARSRPPAVPGPKWLAALWLDGFVRSPLRAADGTPVGILQPGLPEHPGSLRMIETVLAFGDGEPRRGAMTVGTDIVWNGGEGSVLRLEGHLLAPWEEIAEVVDPVREGEAPLVSAAVAPERLLPFLEAAGAWRLFRRARRLQWRIAAAGREQAVWEGLAEALGYGGNQGPFRHLARRLPLAHLAALPEAEREALLFGVAGFLPSGDAASLSPEARETLRPLWERWWKARAGLEHAVLPSAAWKHAGVRPANRPERRLAALSRLVPHVPRLVRAVERRDPAIVARICSECHDPFWSRHAAWTGKRAEKPSRLVGDDRAEDLLLNLFWPLVALREPHGAAEALTALAGTAGGGSRAIRETAAAWGLSGKWAKACRSALVQQGLLQARRDLPGDPAGDLVEWVRRWEG